MAGHPVARHNRRPAQYPLGAGMGSKGEGKLSEKKVIAVKDWTCAMSDELGRVALRINPTDGEPVLVLMTIFQAAKIGRELQSPKRVQLSI